MKNSQEETLNNAVLNFFNAPHLRLNKNIIDTYGIDVALWIADIFSRWNYFRKENKLEDGYFFITQEKIRESTKLNFSKQTSIIKLLTKEKIIKVQRKGIPAKNWYKINTMVLISKMEDSRSKFLEIEGTTSLKSKPIYNKDSLQESFNNSNKNNIYSIFLEKWNEQKIVIHKKITSKRKTAIDKVLKTKDYSQEEIFKAFQNYAIVLHSPDYFWNYVWPMEDFLQRGLHKFVDEVGPLTNLKADPTFSDSQSTPLSETKLSPAGFPLITRSYDRTAKKRKTREEWQKLFEGYEIKLLNADIWKENHIPDTTAVFNNVISMQEWLDNVDFSLYGGASLCNRIKPLNKLIDYYIICINDWWDWMGGVKDNAFDVNSKIFKMFIREMENSFATHIDIKSKNWKNDSDWTPRS